METTVEVIAVVSTIVAIILAIVAGSKNGECKNLEERYSLSEKEYLKSILLLRVKEHKIISIESKLKAASDKRDEWHNKYLDAQDETTEYSVKLTNAKIEEDKWKAIATHHKAKYTALIAMPRRKRDKMIAELRKSNN